LPVLSPALVDCNHLSPVSVDCNLPCNFGSGNTLSSIYQWLETGALPTKPSIPAHMIQSSWSMWNLVLLALGFEIVQCFTLEEFMVATVDKAVSFCFLHGSFKFVKQFWLHIQGQCQVRASLELGEKPTFKQLTWCFLEPYGSQTL
jgi:hypothetical protein